MSCFTVSSESSAFSEAPGQQKIGIRNSRVQLLLVLILFGKSRCLIDEDKDIRFVEVAKDGK